MEERKTEFLRSQFEQIESSVQFGDHKASLLVAGDAILLAICGGLIRMVSGCPKDDFTVSCMVPSVSLGLATIAAALLIWSLFCALLAARPSKVHAKPPTEFFLLSHIAHMERKAFIEAYEDTSYSDIVEEALVAIHGKAVYANQKFRWLRRAVQATLLSLGFIVLTLLVAVASHVFA
jgi:hypothetical protein